MEDDLPPDDRPRPDPGPVHNEHRGVSDFALMAGSVRGGVHHHGVGRHVVTLSLAVVAVALVVVLVAVVRDDPDPPPAASPTSAPATTTGTPLVVAVRAQTHDCLSDWFTTRAPAEVPSGPSFNHSQDWDRKPGIEDGAFADEGEYLVTLQGLDRERAVQITDARVRFVARVPAPAGTVLNTRCGDPGVYRVLDIDLDAERPVPVGEPLSPQVVEAARSGGWRVEPVAFPYEVSAMDSESFLVRGRTAACDCSWVLEFHWSSGDRTGELVVDDNGRPFRVVGGANSVRCSVSGEVVC
ncbi:hypothetical protein [Saccharothrix lopnurensis]|uniref:Uncharacterized protein n=1 Tax=Saccharothrix lopnurensis TaxID=1670621 RepID=A0ABW1P168_9PSEU